MKKIKTLVTGLFLIFFIISVHSQEDEVLKRIQILEYQKTQIKEQERNALKEKITEINKQLKKGLITENEAEDLKKEEAKKRALNIDNQLAIIDNRIALLKRNGKESLDTSPFANDSTQTALFEENRKFLGIRLGKKSELPKKDKRTKSNFVIGTGFFSNRVNGSFNDPVYSYLRGRYYEVGFTWTTRVLKNKNWFRLNYGVIFDRSRLISKNSFLEEEKDEFFRFSTLSFNSLSNANLTSSRVRFDSFSIPIHFEFGPSKKRQYGDYTRYSTNKKLRIGLGLNYRYLLNRAQILKRGSDQIFDSNTSLRVIEGNTRRFRGGFSFYLGRGDTMLILKLEDESNSISTSFLSESGFLDMRRTNVWLGLRVEL